MNQKEIIAQMEEEITSLFGESAYRVERSPCRGKYRGHNDYSLVFGSGKKLYIGLDWRNYAEKLREKLEQIRHFRAHQVENTEKIRTVVRESGLPFNDASVEIRPCDGSRDLCVYAVVILSTKCGIRFLYRETSMHYYLTGCDGKWCAFDRCVQIMRNDILGEMRCTRVLTEDAA